ncbi:MAG: universal stress protein [Actinomycetota bacterium]
MARTGAALVSVTGDANAIVDAANHGDALIVMTALGRYRAGAVRSELAETVLRSGTQPALLIGPHVAIGSDWPTGPLLVCSDGTDFSEAIVEPAAQLAKRLDLATRILLVTDGDPVADCSDAGRRVRSLAGKVESIVGSRVHYDLLHDADVAQAISDHGQWYRASLIAMTTHVRTSVDRLAHGSVAMAVVHRARCPVLVRGPMG